MMRLPAARPCRAELPCIVTRSVGSESGMIIRAIDTTDIPDIAAMHLASWRAAYDGIMPAAALAALSTVEFEASWRSQLSDAQRTHLLCESQGMIAGFVGCGPCRDREVGGRSIGEIYELYTHPIRWKQGTGRALCEAALAVLEQKHFSEISLWVLRENERARRFYEAMQFLQDSDGCMIIHRFDMDLVHVRYRRTIG